MNAEIHKSTRTRVLVVDDSAIARRIIVQSLAQFRDIEVVGTAEDPYVARDRILELKPDVVTLDIEMPRMDGITFLKILMKHRPQPVIILSSLSTTGSRQALEALQAGAVDVLAKPNGPASADAGGTVLAQKIRAASRIRLNSQTLMTGAAEPEKPNRIRSRLLNRPDPRSLILLGASTGGTEALRHVLVSLGGDLPCICIVQHIPAYFSKAFADRLNAICEMEVREAVDGDSTRPGLALVAPGGFHMTLEWAASHYRIRLTQGPPIHYQRPAVDILFQSALRAGAAPHSQAALLTGMGIDGAQGLLQLRKAGARTIAQDEATSVVYGMPREAANLGAAELILPLSKIGPAIEGNIIASEHNGQGTLRVEKQGHLC